MTRKATDWVRSMTNHNSTHGIVMSLRDRLRRNPAVWLPVGEPASDVELVAWQRRFYDHIRDHFKTHPALNFYEFALEAPHPEKLAKFLIMPPKYGKLFWGHANVNAKIHNTSHLSNAALSPSSLRAPPFDGQVSQSSLCCVSNN